MSNVTYYTEHKLVYTICIYSVVATVSKSGTDDNEVYVNVDIK